jgi:hypothetical protein
LISCLLSLDTRAFPRDEHRWNHCGTLLIENSAQQFGLSGSLVDLRCSIFLSALNREERLPAIRTFEKPEQVRPPLGSLPPEPSNTKADNSENPREAKFGLSSRDLPMSGYEADRLDETGVEELAGAKP